MNGSGNNPRMAIDPSKNRMPSGLRLVWEKKYSKAAKSFTEYMDDEDADLSNFEKAKVLCNRAWCYLSMYTQFHHLHAVCEHERNPG